MQRRRARRTAAGIGLSAVRQMVLTAGLFAALALACAASATAAGKPVNVGTPLEAGQPAVAVTSAGNAVIAWANTKDLAPVTTNIVQYCVLPAGATGCLHSGDLTPADSAQAIANVQVLNEGSTLVILADVFGAAGNNSLDYTPEQEWQSPDGGATWTVVNGGISVSSGIIDADTQPLSAVTVPGTGVLGYGWDTAGASAPTFNAFPLSSPPECSVQTCPAGYATLEPDTNPDQLGNEPGQFAAESGASPGVMGVFETLFTNGPLGCAKSFGTAYVYGAGVQSPSNNYNISPGSPNSAWRVALSQADCDVDNPAVGGGPSGFGILEDNEASGTTVYHRFDVSTEKFDAPLATLTGHGELDPALSQDGAGGIYATYLEGGDGGPIALSYSADGGHTFATSTIQADKDGGIGSVNSSVNSAGQGWVAWLDNGSVFAQSFQAADAVAAATVSGGASSNGQTVTLNVSCATVPCALGITLSVPKTVVLHAASVPRRKGKGKTLTLGKGKFTLTKAGAKKLSINLSAAAKRLLKNKHGHFKVTAAISETVQHKTIALTKTLTLTVKPSGKSRK